MLSELDIRRGFYDSTVFYAPTVFTDDIGKYQMNLMDDSLQLGDEYNTFRELFTKDFDDYNKYLVEKENYYENVANKLSYESNPKYGFKFTTDCKDKIIQPFTGITNLNQDPMKADICFSLDLERAYVNVLNYFNIVNDYQTDLIDAATPYEFFRHNKGHRVQSFKRRNTIHYGIRLGCGVIFNDLLQKGNEFIKYLNNEFEFKGYTGGDEIFWNVPKDKVDLAYSLIKDYDLDGVKCHTDLVSVIPSIKFNNRKEIHYRIYYTEKNKELMWEKGIFTNPLKYKFPYYILADKLIKSKIPDEYDYYYGNIIYGDDNDMTVSKSENIDFLNKEEEYRVHALYEQIESIKEQINSIKHE